MRTLVLASLPLMVAMAVAFGAKAAEKTIVVLGTATPGAVSRLRAGGEPGISRTGATLEYVPSILPAAPKTFRCWRRGKLDIGLVQGEAALEALNGLGRPRADLRIVFAMYATPGMFVVRADSPYHSIEDLLGKPVALWRQRFRSRAVGWLY